MPEEGHIPAPPTKRQLLQLTLIGFVVGSVVVIGFILPAEMHIDLTGFGQWSGLNRLAGPKEITVALPSGPTAAAHKASMPFRTDEVDIALKSGDYLEGSELEYKVYAKSGDTFVYSWKVSDPPPTDEFYYDFHSQSDPTPDVRVVSYEQATGINASGSLTVPFAGYHGWYFQNQSARPVTVHLRLAGFYRLVSREELDAAAAGVPPPEFPSAPADLAPPPAVPSEN